MKKPLNVILANQSYFIQQGLIKSLDESPYSRVSVTPVNSDKELLVLSNTNNYDLIITNTSLPKYSPVDVLQEVRSKGILTPVLFLSECTDERVLKKAYKLGHAGVVHSACGREEFNKAIQTILNGQDYYAHEAAVIIMNKSKSAVKIDENAPLSSREKEVLNLSALEYTTNEIAEKLNISVRTVEGHKLKIKTKFNSKTWVGVIQSAHRRGLLI